MKRRSFVTGLLASAAGGCVGSTGGELLELEAAAAGPSDGEGSALSFENGRGYRVRLEKCRLFVGGLYLNRARPASVASDTSCTLPGIYVAQVLSGLDVDLLSPTPQPFPELGFTTSERALTGEVWLTHGDVDDVASSGPLLRASGMAERDGQALRFDAQLSIGKNRLIEATDPALPGQYPICKQRIVSPVPVDLRPRPRRALLLRIDPRGMFANVDFSTLTARDDVHRFADEAGVDQASDNLYAGLRRPGGVYSFSWMEQQ